MPFQKGQPKPVNGGRRKGTPNKKSVARGALEGLPDALAHLAQVMTSNEPNITPELKLRAAVALAQYQRPRPYAGKETFTAAIDYETPKTVEAAREAILALGERLAKGEISVELHDGLINGLRAFLGDKAAEQERKLAELEESLRNGEIVP